MAVWQFDIFLVPASRMRRRSHDTGQRLSEDEFDSTEWWKGVALPLDYVATLSFLVPRSDSWSKHIELWGKEDGDCVMVARSAGQVVDVRVRFDVRSISTQFVEGVAHAASAWHCAIVTEEYEVVPAEAAALYTELQNSSAHRYLLDPGAFLTQDGQLP